MNVDELEILVQKCKEGRSNSKEELIKAFTPLVLSVSKKIFIHGYTLYDIQNECYKTLLYSLNLYNTESHCFAAYASNAIRNNLNDLIKKAVRHECTEGSGALTLSDNLENILPSEDFALETYIDFKKCCEVLHGFLNLLTPEEKEMINFLYIKNQTLISYSHMKNISYSSARYKQRKLLKKLQQKMYEKHIYSIDK